jgi:type II secretory pathway component PulK
MFPFSKASNVNKNYAVCTIWFALYAYAVHGRSRSSLTGIYSYRLCLFPSHRLVK